VAHTRRGVASAATIEPTAAGMVEMDVRQQYSVNISQRQTVLCQSRLDRSANTPPGPGSTSTGCAPRMRKQAIVPSRPR
jgi:hypothetical protein